ncbi:MAG: glycoside hydrolase, partial [Planctomycetes bacterium]|nr:glycoside hydrolase [Planctomycetota bacterium]
MRERIFFWCPVLLAWCLPGMAPAADFQVLKPAAFAHHVERFNTMEAEGPKTYIPNAEAWPWLCANIPLFECPDRQVEEIYYFRWWSLRKHLRRLPQGFVFTEFLTRPVPISSALGHHLMELRWLRDPRYADDYVRYWLRGHDGRPQPHLHRYSSWLQDALYQRYLVTHDTPFLVGLLDDLVRDYRSWEQEQQLPSGLFWQYDVWDGMEESISGSRTRKNVRPTINSYMFGNARALAAVARLAHQPDLAREFDHKAADLKQRTQATLWDPAAKFFKVRDEDGRLSDAREAIGFLPWYFDLPDPGYEAAWAQFPDPAGFHAPFGITTAERRHPRFRSHGCCKCEWDGAVWPFATSQTLVALANVLRDYRP